MAYSGGKRTFSAAVVHDGKDIIVAFKVLSAPHPGGFDPPEAGELEVVENLEMVEDVDYPKIMEPIYNWIRGAFNGEIEVPLLDAARDVRHNLESFRDVLGDIAEETKDAETQQRLWDLAEEV